MKSKTLGCLALSVICVALYAASLTALSTTRM